MTRSMSAGIDNLTHVKKEKTESQKARKVLHSAAPVMPVFARVPSFIGESGSPPAIHRALFSGQT